MEDIVVVRVADATDRLADDRADVHHGIKCGAFDFRDGDFTAYHDGVAFHKGLAGDAAGFVNREACVEHGI